jgi:nitrogen regulatory protein PII
MTQMVSRRRIEVLVDVPLVRRVEAAAAAAGVTGYTLLPTLRGSGERGAWTDDQISGAEAKVMFLTVASDEKADALIAALAPLLESHGLILMMSVVDVVRGGKF